MSIKEQLDTDGLVGPFVLSHPEKLVALADKVLASREHLANFHCREPLVDEVLADPALMNRVTELFGRDSLVWRTNFFIKQAGSAEVGWHHDKHFEDGDRPIDLTNLDNHFSILIAVTDVGLDGGAIRYLKGSHLPTEGLGRDLRPYHLRRSQEHFVKLPDTMEHKVTAIPLKMGQFALFHSSLLHHSLPFQAGDTRISMIARLAKSSVRIPNQLAPNDAVHAYT